MVLTLLAVFGVLFATTQPSSGGVLDVVDDADPRVQYTGSWVPYTAVNSTQFWSGTVTYTNISGAMAKLAFTGDSVQVFGAFNLSGHLNMSSRYTLDDATPVMFSPPSVVETPIFRRQFYASGLIAFGQHVLTIENLGEQFWLDSIHVDGPNGTLSSVSVMQSNTVLTTQAHPTPSSSADDPATTQPVRAPSAGGTSTVSGVVAGAVVAGILLVSMLLGGLWWRRRQRRMRQAVPPEIETSTSGETRPWSQLPAPNAHCAMHQNTANASGTNVEALSFPPSQRASVQPSDVPFQRDGDVRVSDKMPAVRRRSSQSLSPPSREERGTRSRESDADTRTHLTISFTGLAASRDGMGETERLGRRSLDGGLRLAGGPADSAPSDLTSDVGAFGDFAVLPPRYQLHHP